MRKLAVMVMSFVAAVMLGGAAVLTAVMPARAAGVTGIEAVEGGGDEPDGDAGDDGRLIEADADGKAHAGGGPEAGGGGEALHLVAAGDDDGPRPQEADAADDLGPQPGGIPGAVGLDDVLIGEDGQGGTQADQDVGAEAGRAAFPPPLDADDAAAEDGHHQPQEDGEPVDLVDQLGPLLVTIDAQHVADSLPRQPESRRPHLYIWLRVTQFSGVVKVKFAKLPKRDEKTGKQRRPALPRLHPLPTMYSSTW